MPARGNGGDGPRKPAGLTLWESDVPPPLTPMEKRRAKVRLEQVRGVLTQLQEGPARRLPAPVLPHRSEPAPNPQPADWRDDTCPTCGDPYCNEHPMESR